jgi:hypothetical protein
MRLPGIMTTMLATRRATNGDVDALVADVAAGFASYVDFAPSGWQPPDMSAERDRTAEQIAEDETWALLALAMARRPDTSHSSPPGGGRRLERVPRAGACRVPARARLAFSRTPNTCRDRPRR